MAALGERGKMGNSERRDGERIWTFPRHRQRLELELNDGTVPKRFGAIFSPVEMGKSQLLFYFPTD